MRATFQIIFVLILVSTGVAAFGATKNLVNGTTYNPSDFLATDDVVVATTNYFNAGVYTFNSLTIATGRTLYMVGNYGGSTAGVTINAATITLTGTGKIVGTGYGYTSGSGPGTTPWATSGGAGHGGVGGIYNASYDTAGISYGDAVSPTTFGSSTWNGAAGGTAIKLVATTISLAAGSSIKSDGSSSSVGGSAGGSIWIITNSISNSGTISVNGGAGSSSAGGGGGRISIKYSSASTTGTLTATAGTGGSGAVGGTIVIDDGTNPVTCTGGGDATMTGTLTGDVSISAGCKWKYTGDVSVNSFSLAASSYFELAGNLTITSSLTLASGSRLVMDGDTTTGFGYTISAASASIASTASLDANGTGYGSAQGPGTGTSYYTAAGAGYGGAGGKGDSFSTTGGTTYGSPINPNLLGSGGGAVPLGGGAAGGSGGGVVKLILTGSLTLNGTISSNGNAGLNISSNPSGGGSGGSVWIEANSISGAGTISAAGGAGINGSGGGGGGRVYVKYATNTYTGTATAAKGVGGSTSSVAGSVVLIDSTTGNWTCSSTLTTTGSSLSGDLNISGGCKLVVNGDTNLTSVTVAGSGTVVTFNGDLTVLGSINVSTSGEIVMGSDTVTGYGYTVSAVNMTVASTAKFDGDSQGYTAGLGNGKGNTGTSYASGAGHGGPGGAVSGGSAGTTYDTQIQPTLIGSGGGTYTSSIGGTGGGAIKILIVSKLQVDGTLSANGGAATGTRGGGGSGGTLWIVADEVAGGGTISANGGAASGASAGSGGGGRVYISTTTKSFTGTSAVARGTTGVAGADVGNGAGVGTFIWATLGSPVKLVFSQQPSASARKNLNFSTQPIIVAQDSASNVVSNFSGTVTFTAYSDSSCTTPASGTFAGSYSNINGFLWYSGVKYDTPATIYVQGNSGGLAGTACFQVTVGGNRATQLVFTTQPSTSSTAGAAFAQQPVVQAVDDDGNVDVLAGVAVLDSYANASCTIAAWANMNETPTQSAPGVTSFSNTNATVAGNYYARAYAVVDGVAIYGCSAGFTIVPGPLYRVQYTGSSPSSGTAGTAFSPQYQITGADLYGNAVTTLTTDVTLSAFSNSGCTTAGTGTLGGPGPYTPDGSGLVTTSGVSYTKSGAVYIKASASGLVSACSSVVNISAGPPASLVFTTQPASTGVQNVNLRVSPVVGALDAYGNTATYSSVTSFDAYTDATCTSAASGATVATRIGATNGYQMRYSKAEVVYFRASYGALTPACSNSVSLNSNYPTFFRRF